MSEVQKTLVETTDNKENLEPKAKSPQKQEKSQSSQIASTPGPSEEQVVFSALDPVSSGKKDENRITEQLIANQDVSCFEDLNENKQKTHVEGNSPLQNNQEDSKEDAKTESTLGFHVAPPLPPPPPLPSKYAMEQPINERELLFKSSIDRKRLSFSQLREWDAVRASFLGRHRNIIEDLIQSLQEQLQISEQLFHGVVRFYQEKMMQELNYCRHPIPQSNPFNQKIESETHKKPHTDNTDETRQVTEKAQQTTTTTSFSKDDESTTSSSEESKNQERVVYDSLRLIINSIDQLNLEHTQRVAQFASVIDEKILQQLMFNEEMGKKLHTFRENIVNLRNSIKQINLLAEQKCKKIGDVYTRSTPTQGYSLQMFNQKGQSKDFFQVLISFMRTANEQRDIQKLYARHVIGFWKCAIEFEKCRAERIHQSFEIYCESHLNCYGHSDKAIEQVRQLFIPDASVKIASSIESLFSAQNVFLPEEIGHFKTELQSEVIRLQEVQVFLENFHFDNVDERVTIMKELKIARALREGNFRSTRMVITCDFFIHCFDIAQNQGELETDHPFEKVKKPELSFKLQETKIQQMENNVAEVSTVSNLFLGVLSQTEKFYFQFNSSDQLEEFRQFIRLLN